MESATTSDASQLPDFTGPEYQKQPAGLYRLFFAEMWERFSFYGMRALLVLYMVRQLAYSNEKAYGIYAAYGALVYSAPIIGGAIADRVLGFRWAIILGGTLMAIGHFVMAIEQEYFFFGALSLIILGNGFFKPNISSLVGKLYPNEQDPRRDRGFTIFYMGINLGALLAPIFCGFIGETYGWHYGFGLAGIGMVLGLLVFVQGQKVFGEKGLPPDPTAFKKWTTWVLLGSVLAVPMVMFLVINYHVTEYVLIVLIVAMFVGLTAVAFAQKSTVQRDRLLVVVILLFFSSMFWAFFEQAGSSLTLFTDRVVDRAVGGIEIPTSTFQSVNPIFIVLFAPLFSVMWARLNRRGLEPSTPVKFALGLLQLGIGFGMLYLGSQSAEAGVVALLFLIVSYFFQTTGELSLSPIGLSMVTKLSPGKIVAFVMGAWLMSSAAGHLIAGQVAKLTDPGTPDLPSVNYLPSLDNAGGVKAFQTEDAFTLALVESPTVGSVADSALIRVNVRKGEPTALPTEHRIINYATVEPGKAVELPLHSVVLDPKEIISSYKLIEPGLLEAQVTLNDNKLAYRLPDSARGTDTLQYLVCDTREGGLCDTVLYVINAGAQPGDRPVAYRSTLTLQTQAVTTPELGGLFESTNYVPVNLDLLQLGYHPNGEPLEIHVVEGPKAGFIKVSGATEHRVSRVRTMLNYTSVYFYVFLSCAGAALFLLLLSPLIKRWMHGVK